MLTPHTLLGRVTYTDNYKSDNEAVWKLIVKWYKDHLSWIVARPHQRGKDGMSAYHALYKSFLRPSSIDNVVASSEFNLKGSRNSGEAKK